MGIKNLTYILNTKCSIAKNTRKLNDYTGTVIGIDTSIFLYKYLYNGDILEGITKLILRLVKNGITPIFIYDGRPPKDKKNTLQERREKRSNNSSKAQLFEYASLIDTMDYEEFKTKMKEFTDASGTSNVEETELHQLFQEKKEELMDKSNKLKIRSQYPTFEQVDETKRLLTTFGIPYIHEKECEAEALMAIMCQRGLLDACISDDSDVLVNGGNILLRNVNHDKNTTDEYCLEGILNCLGLSHDAFIDMCILCGCDYSEKIKGIGPMNAYKIICKYGSIESFLAEDENYTRYEIPDDFNYLNARRLFQCPVSEEVYERVKCIPLNLRMPNIGELKTMIVNCHDKARICKEIDEELVNYYLHIGACRLV